MFFRKAVSNEDDEYKASQQTYYNIAHSSKEVIVEQPAILVGGQLKAYQVIHLSRCLICKLILEFVLTIQWIKSWLCYDFSLSRCNEVAG